MASKEIYTAEENWMDLPLHQILYKWFVQNANIAIDMTTVVASIGFLLISWYAVVFFTRFIMFIIRPLCLIAAGIVVLRVLKCYEPEEIANIIDKSFTIVFTTLMTIVNKSLELILMFLDYLLAV